MSRLLLPSVLAVCFAAVLSIPAPVVAAPPTKVEEELVEKVRKAIDNGVKYLKKQQSPQGTWEGVVLQLLADMEGGGTALTTLALLNCGVKPDDPTLVRAIAYLEKLPPKKTYVVGLQNLV